MDIKMFLKCFMKHCYLKWLLFIFLFCVKIINKANGKDIAIIMLHNILHKWLILFEAQQKHIQEVQGLYLATTTIMTRKQPNENKSIFDEIGGFHSQYYNNFQL